MGAIIEFRIIRNTVNLVMAGPDLNGSLHVIITEGPENRYLMPGNFPGVAKIPMLIMVLFALQL
jgi:hypothetical protein